MLKLLTLNPMLASVSLILWWWDNRGGEGNVGWGGGALVGWV